MADSSSQSGNQPKSADRRTFLKVGAGVVAGAAIASVVEIPYYSSVLGGNSSSSSSSVSSLKSQLSSTQEQLSSTAAQLGAAQGQVTSLNNQLTSTLAQLNSASSQLSGVSAQLSSTEQALTSANGQISTLGGQVTSLNGQVTSLNTQVSSLNTAVSSAKSQVTSLQSEVSAYSGNSDALTTLGVQEAAVVEAAAEAMIPTDSNGPGAKEAGVIYFIDRQLTGDYGNNGRMYNQGPFIQTNVSSPITVMSSKGTPITYSGGTMPQPWAAGTYYQYAMSLRNFWRFGIQALETYSNSAYGGNFESLSAANKVTCLQDLFNNKPTSFNSIKPSDFANELFFMVWAGFLMDPMYGGNRGMVGWTMTASPGVNFGNFYGEGLTSKQLMVASTPTILKPVSLAQYQQSVGVAGVQGGT
ncbi:MAG: gluconate 2-dehydrogenase subunit 3 family protein [Thaumarchaeota archaeon]|nr:gluconate 2-dehydrogenase subunit 3 family protein [Nitrososphaerota archaeon]